MTVTKEAISRAIFDPGATEGYKGERTLTEWQADAVIRALSTLPIAGEPLPPELSGPLQWAMADAFEASEADTTPGKMIDVYNAVRSALPSSPGKDGGQEVEAVELIGIAKEMAEESGFWRSCSGCHNLNEGVPTGPYSSIMKCHLGFGCQECGGIGAIWDNVDYSDFGKDGGKEAEVVTCERCQGNGEIVTNWERYERPHEGDVGDEAVAECPDCNGEGRIDTEHADLPQSPWPASDWALEKIERLTKALEPFAAEADEFAETWPNGARERPTKFNLGDLREARATIAALSSSHSTSTEGER